MLLFTQRDPRTVLGVLVPAVPLQQLVAMRADHDRAADQSGHADHRAGGLVHRIDEAAADAGPVRSIATSGLRDKS